MPKAMKDLPVHSARAYLEPGPVVFVSSAHEGVRNVMTMGWHTILEFSPSLLGCMISSGNHSFDLIRKSGECVINLPTVDMIDLVVAIGNSSGRDIDKFEHLDIAVGEASEVRAPLLTECFGQFECRTRMTRSSIATTSSS